MKRKITFFMAALCAVMMVALPMKVWATDVLSWSRSGSTNTYTSGYTFSATASANNNGYYQDGSGTTGIKLYSTQTPICSSTPSSVTFTASVGGGSGNKDLSNSVYVCYIDSSGDVIANTETEVTSHITTAGGDTYNIIMPTSSATSAYGIYIYHTKETGYNVRYYSFSLSYVAGGGGSTPSITANNVNIACDATGGSIGYTLNNGNGNISASITGGNEGNWLVLDTENITASEVPFTCSANTGAQRTATVTLSFTGAQPKVVTVTQAAYIPTVPGYDIDFEEVAAAYTDWTFTNMDSKQTGNNNVTAHGGTYYGTTGGKATASIVTNAKIATPYSLTCYVTRQSTNTTASSWKIQVSSDGSTWTDVATQSATSMSQGSWVEFTANLTSYSNVYVRVYYDGSTAVRNIDDLSLVMGHTVTYSAAHGSIGGVLYGTSTSVASGARIAEGGKLTLTATPTPNTSYAFSSWSVEGTGSELSSTSTNPTTFTMGTANATVTADFELPTNYINVTPTNPSTVSVAGGNVVINVDTDQQLTAESVQFYTASEGGTTTDKPSWIGTITYNSSTTPKTLTVQVLENTSIARSTYFTLKNAQVESSRITVNQAAITVVAPSFDPAAATFYTNTTVNISSETEDAYIYYTTDGSTPAANNGTQGTSVTISAEGSTTLKAIAIKNGVSSDVTTGTYIIHHALTTMDAIFAAAEAGEGDEVECYVTFNNWVVTGVNGSQAFVTDGTKGFVIYKSSNGFTVGNIISGTTTNKVKIKIYNGFAEFTNLTTSTSGISVTSGGTVSPQVVTIGDMSGVNTGAVITLNGLTYNSTTGLLSDGVNTITPYTTLHSGSYTNGSTYNITGVYQQQSEAPHRILPRSAADIVEVLDPVITAATSLEVPNYVVGASSSAILYETLTVNGSNLTADITVALNGGSESDFEISDDLDEWGHSLVISRGSGTVSNAEIAVRLKSGKSKNEYSDQINLTSTGATQVDVDVTGSVYYAHVTYDGNGSDGGSVPTDSEDYEYEEEVTVLGQNTLTRTGYDFLWWNTEADGNGDDYAKDETFNITENVTLYALWDAITYNIGKSAMTNGNVTFQVGGVAATTAKTDQTVTIVVTPSAGYVLSSLTVINDATSAAVAVSNNTFKMPGSDVTVSATFISGVTDAMTPSTVGVNGSSYSNWSNKSWTSQAKYAGNTSGNSNPAVTIQMRTDNSNSGIVTTTSGGKIKKIIVTWSSTPANTNGRKLDVYGKNTAYSAASDLYNNLNQGTSLGSITYSTGVYTGELVITGDYEYIGLRSNSGTIYLAEIDVIWAPTYTVTYNANAEGATGTTTDANKYVEGATVTVKANGFTHPSSYTFNSWNTAADGSGTTYAPAATFTMGTANVTLYAQWNRNDLPVNGSTHELESSTTVNEGEVVTVSSKIIIPNGITLTVDGTLVNTTAANLVIENLGQLILPDNATVAATIKKTTSASTEATGSKDEAVNNWYAIASPVNNVAISSFAQGTHNVYCYDEPTHYWQEYHSALNTNPAYNNLTNGRGYIYRSTVANVEYAGNVNAAASITCPVTCTNEAGALKGFNLIGNPYTHNITKGASNANILNGTLLEENYYVLRPNGTWTLTYDGGEIAPGTAILVQATTKGDVTITNEAPTGGGKDSRFNNDNIWFTVKNNEFIDKACVEFKEGRGLNKMAHYNENAPMLYVKHNGENFASVDMPDNTKTINLCFKATEFGYNTMSLKANGNFSYLHLIDRLTGEDVDMLLEGEYSFMASPTDNPERFIVKLEYSEGSETSDSSFAYQNGSDIIVNGEGELQVFDVMGRLMMQKNINGVQTVNVCAQGVYILKLNDKVQKVVVR